MGDRYNPVTDWPVKHLREPLGKACPWPEQGTDGDFVVLNTLHTWQWYLLANKNGATDVSEMHKVISPALGDHLQMRCFLEAKNVSLIIRQVQSDNRNPDIHLRTNETVDKYIGRMQQHPKLQN